MNKFKFNLNDNTNTDLFSTSNLNKNIIIEDTIINNKEKTKEAEDKKPNSEPLKINTKEEAKIDAIKIEGNSRGEDISKKLVPEEWIESLHNNSLQNSFFNLKGKVNININTYELINIDSAETLNKYLHIIMKNNYICIYKESNNVLIATEKYNIFKIEESLLSTKDFSIIYTSSKPYKICNYNNFAGIDMNSIYDIHLICSLFTEVQMDVTEIVEFFTNSCPADPYLQLLYLFEIKNCLNLIIENKKMFSFINKTINTHKVLCNLNQKGVPYNHTIANEIVSVSEKILSIIRKTYGISKENISEEDLLSAAIKTDSKKNIISLDENYLLDIGDKKKLSYIKSIKLTNSKFKESIFTDKKFLRYNFKLHSKSIGYALEPIIKPIEDKDKDIIHSFYKDLSFKIFIELLGDKTLINEMNNNNLFSYMSLAIFNNDSINNQYRIKYILDGLINNQHDLESMQIFIKKKYITYISEDSIIESVEKINESFPDIINFFESFSCANFYIYDRKVFEHTDKLSDLIKQLELEILKEVILRLKSTIVQHNKQNKYKVELLACFNNNIIVSCDKQITSNVISLLNIVMPESQSKFLKRVKTTCETVLK